MEVQALSRSYFSSDGLRTARSIIDDRQGTRLARVHVSTLTSRSKSCNISWSPSSLKVCCGVAEPGGVPAPMGQQTKYNDSFIDVAFMSLFARKMEDQLGGPDPGRSELPEGAPAYERFVATSRQVMGGGRSAAEQRDIVAGVLKSLLPPNSPAVFRRLFPPNKWSAEVNAAITVPFFQWLVGPAELKEVEVNGQKQMSGVQIKKCRYLEASGCVGMCVNMCKLPTQDFFTNDFGLPLTMTPNFEDMSCEMIFGQQPPPLEEDPALQQPCYAVELCSTSSSKPQVACPKLAPILASSRTV
eukprot:TRINITY_DN35621_c0_g1_i1.p1 TRINITY_DN35621_c0_g1~~TRINITY_DN35621_c0_g1_i1.p1  ORF type:complete len:300 (+),score=48.25 TRINITY_DN35621_c0_g1_i1:226-1125(+)